MKRVCSFLFISGHVDQVANQKHNSACNSVIVITCI